MLYLKNKYENELQYCIGTANTAVPGNFTATSSINHEASF